MDMRFSKTPAQVSDITRFEAAIDAALPGDYSSFLLTYNGGKPDPDQFVFRADMGPRRAILDWFLSLGGDVDNDIEQFADILRGRIPVDCLPIAIDPGGNFILLSVSGPRRNQLLFWDHELEADEGEPPSEKNVYPICTGFSTLLDSLLPGAAS
jgi:hypothetical protein